MESENEPSTPDIDEDNVLSSDTLDDENSGGSLADQSARSSTDDELNFDELSSFSSTIPEVDDVVSNVDTNEEGIDEGETSADELGVDELMDHSVDEEEISEGFIAGDDLNTEHTGLDDDLFLPLYPGSTICGAILAIMSFKRECNLPFSTVSKLLLLLKLLCPTGSKLPSSVYMLRKFFRSHQCKKVKRVFCSTCNLECSHGSICSNTKCKTNKSENDVFIQIDMQEQLKNTLSRKLPLF